jgi:hypothetical protein
MITALLIVGLLAITTTLAYAIPDWVARSTRPVTPATTKGSPQS